MPSGALTRTQRSWDGDKDGVREKMLLATTVLVVVRSNVRPGLEDGEAYDGQLGQLAVFVGPFQSEVLLNQHPCGATR